MILCVLNSEFFLFFYIKTAKRREDELKRRTDADKAPGFFYLCYVGLEWFSLVIKSCQCNRWLRKNKL